MLIKSFDSNSKIKVFVDETRVVLVGDHYKPEPAEPVWGSQHECVGTVISFCSPSSEYDVEIKWDNGEGNPYKLEDLRAQPALNKNDPNYTFKTKKHTLGVKPRPSKSMVNKIAPDVKKLSKGKPKARSIIWDEALNALEEEERHNEDEFDR